jgi:small subunit ribosomal protein S20
MPNIASATKRAKQSEARRKINLSRKSAVKTAMKKVVTALNNNEDIAVIKELLRNAESKISRAKGKGVLHRNTAERSIGRLAKKVAAQEKSTKA